MAKLPIGIQTFEKTRSGDYAYVDKLEAAMNTAGDDKALAQIWSRLYAQKYTGEYEVYCIGITFCKQARNIFGFVWEQLDKSIAKA